MENCENVIQLKIVCEYQNMNTCCIDTITMNVILSHPDENKIRHTISLILETWHRRNIKPKFHVSEQGKGRCGHHSDYIKVLPNYLLEIPEKYDTTIDIMIEAKKKELAIFDLYKKYPFLNLKKKEL